MIRSSSSRSPSLSRDPRLAFQARVRQALSQPVKEPADVWRKVKGPIMYKHLLSPEVTESELASLIQLVWHISIPSHESQVRKMTGIADVCKAQAGKLAELIPIVTFAKLNHACPAAITPKMKAIELAARIGPIYRPLIVVEVNRNNLLDDSFHSLSGLSGDTLMRGLKVRFNGEQGADYGGVSNEWYSEVAKEAFGFSSGFVTHDPDHPEAVWVNRLMMGRKEYWAYFDFFGKFLAMALLHKKPLGVTLSVPTLAYILKGSSGLADLQYDFPDQHRLYSSFLEAKSLPAGFETATFSDFDWTGRTEVAWEVGGTTKSLTTKNKALYVAKKIHWEYVGIIEPLLKKMRAGFQSVFPMDVLKGGFLSGRDLQVILRGEIIHTVDALKRIVVVDRSIPVNGVHMQWFWKIVSKYNQETFAKLLQFVTGLTAAPVAGFEATGGRITISRLAWVSDRFTTDELFPRSSTCTRTLFLPLYTSEAKMAAQLLFSISQDPAFYLI